MAISPVAYVAPFLLFLAGPALQAGDWPQILGPHRNGQADGERLLESWPTAGPTALWSFKLGAGYAGPAVLGQTVVVFHRVEKVERVEAVSLTTGKSLWKSDFPANYRGGIDSDIGPRCVPLIHQGAVYVFGAAGDLHCVSLADGKAHWSRSLYSDYRGDEGYFGAGSTPLVIDGKLLVNVGGADDAGLAALALETGKTVWKGAKEAASYSSPTALQLDGRDHALFVTRQNAVCVDAGSGTVRFRFPFGKRGPTVNAATPLVFDGHLFVSASYGVGAQLAKLTAKDPEPVWSNDEVMSSQYATPVHYRGHLYGTHGREDAGRAEFRCIEAQTGKVAWSAENFGVAHAILAGRHLLLLKTDGELVLAEATPAAFRKLASATIGPETTRAIPALSQGRFLCRTSSRGGGGGELRCVGVGLP